MNTLSSPPLIVKETKSYCIEAIRKWTDSRNDYSLIEPFFRNNASFILEKDLLSWLSSESESDYFHAYLGIANGQLLMICVPLYPNGTEKDLADYYVTPFLDLTITLKLEETIVKTTVEKSTITSSMMVRHESVLLPDPFRTPTEITPSTASSEISRWASFGTDWMYKQTVSPSNNISRAFAIPLNDVSKITEDDSEGTSIYCLFALKWVDIFEQMIMTLIFVKVPPRTPEELDTKDVIDSNSSDFARPCPPFCKSKKDFGLL